MARAWISLLGVLGIVTTSCFGFATNRSENVVTVVTNRTESYVHVDLRTSTGFIADEKIRTTDAGKILQDTETKERGITKEDDEKCSSCSEEPSRATSSNDVHHSTNDKLVTINDGNISDVKDSTISSAISLEPKNLHVSLEKNLDNETPRNIVLLLVEDDGSNGETTWKEIEAAKTFSVQGYLRGTIEMSTPHGFKAKKVKRFRFAPNFYVPECDEMLRANIENFFAWAQQSKAMGITTYSATDFSFPFPGSWGPGVYTGKSGLDVFNVRNAMNFQKQVMLHRRIHDRPKNSSIEPKKTSTAANSTPQITITDSVEKPDGVNGLDGMWDVFDMFSRIRMAFFRLLLETLGNLNGPEDEFPGRKPFLAKRSPAERVTDLLREIMATDGGFVMAIAAPASELSSIVKALQSEVSAEDTLLVVAGMCSDTCNGTVPFFANGPGEKVLRNVDTVWELPLAIRASMDEECDGKFCKNRHHVEPLYMSVLKLLPFRHDNPHKRIARAKEDDETTLSTVDDKVTKDSIADVENNSDEKTAVPELGKRSEESGGASMTRVKNMTAMLGIVTSITAMRVLRS